MQVNAWHFESVSTVCLKTQFHAKNHRHCITLQHSFHTLTRYFKCGIGIFASETLCLKQDNLVKFIRPGTGTLPIYLFEQHFPKGI